MFLCAARVSPGRAGQVRVFGGVDVLVNCAGITGKTGVKTAEVDVANWDLVHRINLTGTFLCCRAVLPHMVARNYGRIVNIASVAGKEGNAGMAAYSSSKAAVIGLTKVNKKQCRVKSMQTYVGVGPGDGEGVR